MSFTNDPQWQKVTNFARGWRAEAERMIDLKINQTTKACSQDQNRDAPRRTGEMANKTYQIKNGPMSYSCVSDKFYAPYVNYGTWRMAPRKFFTDNMEKHKPMIIDGVNDAFMQSIRRFFPSGV